jgi:hypothetical protein
MTAKETWKIEDGGKMISMEFSNKMSGNESTGKYFYDKVK